MIDVIRNIREIATTVQGTTSMNDDRHEQMQDIIELCDNLSDHFIDDMK